LESSSALALCHSGSAKVTKNAPTAANESTNVARPISVSALPSGCRGGGGGSETGPDHKVNPGLLGRS
jgi:hypothetical protein